MKRIVLFFIGFFISLLSFSQEIVNVVYVGENGITEDVKKANAFILIKKYPDGFQRLDYKFSAPLQMLRTYSDSTLKVLEGNYYEYDVNGAITVSGYYHNNLKEKDWYFYDDTAKVIREEKYEAGVLIKTINPDTIKNKEDNELAIQDVEKEAIFGKKPTDWGKYLSKNINGEVSAKSAYGGTVVVTFVVNTSGKCVDVHLQKSVEFVLDDEALRVIEKSPLWESAIQNGRKVNAYRRQPLTFVKQ